MNFLLRVYEHGFCGCELVLYVDLFLNRIDGMLGGVDLFACGFFYLS